MWRIAIVLLLSQMSAGRSFTYRPADSRFKVKQVPFATLYTRPHDDGQQMDPKHVEVW
jgi:hypothetical protein